MLEDGFLTLAEIPRVGTDYAPARTNYFFGVDLPRYPLLYFIALMVDVGETSLQLPVYKGPEQSKFLCEVFLIHFSPICMYSDAHIIILPFLIIFTGFLGCVFEQFATSKMQKFQLFRLKEVIKHSF